MDESQKGQKKVQDELCETCLEKLSLSIPTVYISVFGYSHHFLHVYIYITDLSLGFISLDDNLFSEIALEVYWMSLGIFLDQG